MKECGSFAVFSFHPLRRLRANRESATLVELDNNKSLRIIVELKESLPLTNIASIVTGIVLSRSK